MQRPRRDCSTPRGMKQSFMQYTCKWKVAVNPWCIMQHQGKKQNKTQNSMPSPPGLAYFGGTQVYWLLFVCASAKSLYQRKLRWMNSPTSWAEFTQRALLVTDTMSCIFWTFGRQLLHISFLLLYCIFPLSCTHIRDEKLILTTFFNAAFCLQFYIQHFFSAINSNYFREECLCV